MGKTTKEKSRASMIIDGDIEPSTLEETKLLNLRKRVSFNQMDKEKHREISRKGGQAVAELYGEKKTAKQALENILSLKVTDTMLSDSEVSQSLLNRLRQSNPNATIYDLIQAVAVEKALSGSMRGIEYVRDTNGDKPTDKIDVSGEIVTDRDRELMESIAKRLDGAESIMIVDNQG